MSVPRKHSGQAYILMGKFSPAAKRDHNATPTYREGIVVRAWHHHKRSRRIQWKPMKRPSELRNSRWTLLQHRQWNLLQHNATEKKISLEHMAPDEQTKASNEAALLKSLRHQNITEYLGSFVLGNMLHIVMEYCSGGTLQQAMARRERASESFEEEEVFDWFLQIGMALEFIHSKMILHRDIKPSNVFLTKRNLVKLGDFGIAKQMDDTSVFALTCVGTPYYLSPELIEGRPYNQFSDVWALGVLPFQMVAFRYPFDAPMLPALALKIVNGDHHPLKEDTPADLRELIAILLARSQVERPRMEAVMSLPAVTKRRARFESEMRSLYRGATQTTLASGPPRPATPAAADGVADLQRSQISTGSTIGASSIGPSLPIGGGTLLVSGAAAAPAGSAAGSAVISAVISAAGSAAGPIAAGMVFAYDPYTDAPRLVVDTLGPTAQPPLPTPAAPMRPSLSLLLVIPPLSSPHTRPTAATPTAPLWPAAPPLRRRPPCRAPPPPPTPPRRWRRCCLRPTRPLGRSSLRPST
jgi:NIMA (never in mitosis gene a)-related kinase 1/4/5